MLPGADRLLEGLALFELILLRLRVLRGEITFDELRGWFAARLR
jgi:hypothetical protein